jgi:hypothetical protein
MLEKRQEPCAQSNPNTLSTMTQILPFPGLQLYPLAIYANLQIRLGNKNANYVGPGDTLNCWYYYGMWELVLATGRDEAFKRVKFQEQEVTLPTGQ